VIFLLRGNLAVPFIGCHGFPLGCADGVQIEFGCGPVLRAQYSLDGTNGCVFSIQRRGPELPQGMEANIPHPDLPFHTGQGLQDERTRPGGKRPAVGSGQVAPDEGGGNQR
jgi:hypothetical protein